jgi:crotonobetainyl-CoA hydratase
LSVTTEIDGQVLVVTIDRPKANAIDVATSRALASAFDGFAAAPELRVAVVTGAGSRFFSAGMDLKSAAAGENELTDFGPGGFAGLWCLLALDKPVIAAVNGLAVGGGFELALAADIIVAAPQAEFFLPEMSVGNMADAGGVQRLPRRVPYHLAMEMLLAGRRLGAEEGRAFGLVNRIGGIDPLPAALDLARTIAAGAPLSAQAIKQVVRETARMTEGEAMRAVLLERRFPAYTRMLASEDYQEGPRAFAEKRPPAWKGR